MSGSLIPDERSNELLTSTDCAPYQPNIPYSIPIVDELTDLSFRQRERWRERVNQIENLQCSFLRNPLSSRNAIRCDDFPLTKRFPSLAFLRCWGVDADCSGEPAGPYPAKNRRALNPKIHSSRTFLQKRFNTDMSTQIPHTHTQTIHMHTNNLAYLKTQSVRYVCAKACHELLHFDSRRSPMGDCNGSHH